MKYPTPNLPNPGTKAAQKRGCICVGKNKDGEILVATTCELHVAYFRFGRTRVMYCTVPDPKHKKVYLEIQKGWGHPKRYAAQELAPWARYD